MTIFLVTASDYDYALIDSAWSTREEAEARIEAAQTTPRGQEGFVEYASNFVVTMVELGAVRGDGERYRL